MCKRGRVGVAIGAWLINGDHRTEGLQKVKDTIQPFDWTYTTDYKGTLSSSEGGGAFQVSTIKVKGQVPDHVAMVMFCLSGDGHGGPDRL